MPKTIKENLKKITPRGLWEGLRYFKKWRQFDAPGSTGFVEMIKTFPSFAKIFLKQNLKTIKKLDFHDAEILLDISEPSELPRLNACRKEPETIEWIKKNFRGGVFYDIGANVGAYSFVANATARGKCVIYAFEPSFSTYAQLSKNIILNRASKNIIPVIFPLSDATGLVNFTYGSFESGTASHTLGGESNDSSQQMISIRLDDAIAKFGFHKPNMIKLDVDGAELAVVKGAAKTLKSKYLKSVLVEITETLPSHKEILKVMEKSGFTLASKHSHMGNKTVFNYIFFRK